MAVNLEKAYLRYANDFEFRFEIEKLRERLLSHITPDDVDAGFHQRTDGGCASPGKLFPGKLEATLFTVSLRNDEVMPPTLPLTFPLGAELMRPRHRVDTICGDALPATVEQCFQTAATLVVSCSDERS